eukprot:TRINITY_DN29511_c0_g1_i11.p1 TRINITY_DN29511_c0_g1~~TRINITY_DN29511_c0_g1_i11.p1  ORF type:complete len:222 (-),score=45.87 TRINITY_DN29511_c0_g1_i11:174-839(-)
MTLPSMGDGAAAAGSSHPGIRIKVLGAGQTVGRSCVLLEFSGCRILLDCGVHVGSAGADHVPDLAALLDSCGKPTLTEFINVVIISHYHLDHIGALPYLTEVIGYDGPIYMSHPTKALGPVMLRDYVKVRGRGKAVPYEAADIDPCFAKVTGFQLQERVQLGELAFTPYYAGHVVGAVMVHLEYRGCSVLYTGDFTTVPDHQLRAARRLVLKSSEMRRWRL